MFEREMKEKECEQRARLSCAGWLVSSGILMFKHGVLVETRVSLPFCAFFVYIRRSKGGRAPPFEEFSRL